MFTLYEDGRKRGAPINYIDYFEARTFLLNEIDRAKQQILQEVEEKSEKGLEHVKDNLGHIYDAANKIYSDYRGDKGEASNEAAAIIALCNGIDKVIPFLDEPNTITSIKNKS